MFDALEAEFASRYTEEELVEKAPLIHKYFHDDVQKKAMRNMILDEGKRLDGRRTDDRFQDVRYHAHGVGVLLAQRYHRLQRAPRSYRASYRLPSRRI